MRNIRSIAVICLILPFGLSFNAVANNELVFEFDDPRDEREAQALADLESATLGTTLGDFINTLIEFNQQLRLRFGGDDGPFYDGEKNEINIPYRFITSTKERFRAIGVDGYPELSAEDATIGAVMHTVFHELAHALIFMNEIPIVGREEDAADSLATILLIDYFEDGHDLALSAAELFDLEGTDSDGYEEWNYSGEHSLDVQRYYQTLCYIYGSAPEEYESVLEFADFGDDRAALCEVEYLDASRNWQKLLSPVLKTPLLEKF